MIAPQCETYTETSIYIYKRNPYFPWVAPSRVNGCTDFTIFLLCMLLSGEGSYEMINLKEMLVKIKNKFFGI